jgi:hypothetical protein
MKLPSSCSKDIYCAKKIKRTAPKVLRDLLLINLHFGNGCSVTDLAAMFRLSRVTVKRIISPKSMLADKNERAINKM